MALRSPNMHDVNPRENLDRAAFILTFVAGVVGGILLKVLGAHPFVTATYAGIILISYAVSAWVGGRLKIEPEAIGDNCYYLGFLFTLASLSYTLYQMADPSGNGGKPIDIPEVISGFGVALSSTIVGVFLRVLLMQMRPDFVAKDRAVRADLNRSYGDFRKDLSGTLSQMKAFSTESIQYAAERDERLRASTEKFLSDHQEALLESADTLAKNIESKFTEAAQQAVKDIASSVQHTNSEAQKAAQELTSDIQAMRGRLNEQEAEIFEDIQGRRKRLIADLEAAKKKMREHDAAMENYIKVTRKAADTMTKRVVPALDAFKKRLDEFPQDAKFEFSDPSGSSTNSDDQVSAVDQPFTVTPSRGRPWQRRPKKPSDT